MLPHGTLDFLYITFMLLPVASLYITYVHWKWYQEWRPSPFIKHLLISSMAVDISTIMFAIVALTLYLDWELPIGLRTVFLMVGILMAVGVKFWRRYDLRQLDAGPFAHEMEAAEDKDFGDKRRALENKHNAD